ncbi:MAG: cupin domain-containing protein [Acidobacteria bacterium]|nr:cupin domain-containing protein [Acidobacteriota bacterium]
MKHTNVDEELRGRAALSAVGALSAEEQLALDEHMAGGCEVCAAQLREFEEVCACLALTVSPVEPPAWVRAKLLARIAGDSSSAFHTSSDAPSRFKEFLTIRADEGEWEETSEGVFVKQLFEDRAKGTATSLIRMRPGAQAPSHRHLGVEECIVLEGDFHVNGEVIGPGGYHLAGAGTIHETPYTVNGTLLLIVGPREGYEVVAAR